jgi:DNA polymerase
MNFETAKLHLETSKLMGVSFLPVEAVSTKVEHDTVPNLDKQQELEQLCISHDASCQHCTTSTSHKQTVFGSGNSDASLLFIGEAPSLEEDAQGVPFVGEAGQKLKQIIQAIGLHPDDAYVTNVLKSRPADDRSPLPTEVDICGAFLKKQIEIIEPDIIVTLGSVATKYILNTNNGISRVRGQWGKYKNIPVLPTFHPAYLLRNYTTEIRKQVWEDMQKVISRLG